MIKNAIRRPKPVLINPRDRKKAHTMSQIVPLPKPISTSLVLRIPKKAQIVSDRNATAPIGIGCKINPAMVATKMANKCYAASESPCGQGRNQMTAPIPNTITHFLRAVLTMIFP